MSRDFTIELARQGDWFHELQFLDADGVPINLAGHTIEWSARAIAGTGDILASAAVTIIDAANGKFEVTWHGPDFDAFGLTTEPVRVAHDLKDTYPDGIVDVALRGQIVLWPEVTP